MDAVAKEQWALALLTARFDCAQQKFFQAEYGRRRRSPAVALALCLTLGAFGAHEFYLGRLRSAALRLLFCWTLIPLLLALLEASFLTRRAHAYNTRMAHTLAEIVAETFAAVREQDREQESEQARGEARDQATWQVGAARTFDPSDGARYQQEVAPTRPLAEERLAPEVLVSAPQSPTQETPPLSTPATLTDAPAQPRTLRAAPVTAPLSEPTSVYPATLSPRMRARLGPSLDDLLAEVIPPAEVAEVIPPTEVADADACADVAHASEPSPIADAPADFLIPLIVPEQPEQPEQPEPSAPFADMDVAIAAPSEPFARDYAKMMATVEPPAAIMGAEPASVHASAPPRIQHIVVRKVALVDDRLIAEAQATRDVIIHGSDEEADAQIAAATDEARAEAMRLLAQMVPSETLAQAQGI